MGHSAKVPVCMAADLDMAICSHFTVMFRSEDAHDARDLA